MTARIYQPARSAMQSGEAKDNWLLEYEPEKPREIEPLMGWTSFVRYALAGEAQVRLQGRGDRLRRAQRYRLSARGAKAGDAQDPVLFRQFRPEPYRSLVALKHYMRPVGRLRSAP